MAELFSILVVTEALEKAYIRDAVSAQEYTPACKKLIAQFKTAKDLGGYSVGDLEVFIKDYKLNCPAATKRLIEIGVPATVEHEVADKGSSRQHVKMVADTTTIFITLMDSIKLNLTATDQLHPLLSDLIQLLNKVGLPSDFDEHKARIKNWLITLHKMRF
ncbi:Vacuolar protein-sorting-associated protein 28 [Irineochytrium annulatum]|nr:Vacuolar protein-sorting-associated protein 28 [Irineochytrium annulatum]